MNHRVSGWLALGAATVCACGSVEVATPDGGPGGGDGGAISVASITPATGATKVGVLATIRIELTGAVDAASVTPAHVHLTNVPSFDFGAGIPAYGVTYDDVAHAITITPSIALGRETSYRVDVDGLTAADQPVAAATATFSTVVNPTLYYADSTSYVSYEHDADGHMTASVTHTAGPDATLGTADDGIARIGVRIPTATGVESVQHTGAGPDGMWRTADDVITGRSAYVIGASGYEISRNYTAGPDGIWATADDTVASFLVIDHDAQHRAIAFKSYDAGPDGLALTADDKVTSYSTDAFSDDWNRVAISYSGPGADGVWFNGDDKFNGITRYEFDGRGALTALTSLAAGADGLPATADDVTTSQWALRDDDHGQSVRLSIVTAAGADGHWGTADDEVGGYYQTTYDAQGNELEYSRWTLGINGIPYDADDASNYREIHDPSR
ncbi:MAG: Ig-like domain-containing protein [Deltaproteobacteria bacterium]|nr:Ig-like domain-containing protein [Deltaproteobacteria bacterium]